MLNGIQIANPNFNSENEQVFCYLHENPNRIISAKEIDEKCLNTKARKSLKSIVQGLNFTGDIKKAFINVSEQGILFRNPIFKKDLDELGITELKFGKE